MHKDRGRRGRDRMVFRFTTACAISACHHIVSSNPAQSIQHYMIKYASGLRQVGYFRRVSRFSLPIKSDRHDIIKILLKIALNTITLTPV